MSKSEEGTSSALLYYFKSKEKEQEKNKMRRVIWMPAIDAFIDPWLNGEWVQYSPERDAEVKGIWEKHKEAYAKMKIPFKCFDKYRWQ